MSTSPVTAGSTATTHDAPVLRVLQIGAVLTVLNLAWQFVTAGQLFPGPDELHALGAIVLHVTSGVTALAAGLHWYRTRTSPAVAVLAAVVFVLTFVQAWLGSHASLALHIPGALVVVVGAVVVLVWSFGRSPRL